MIFAALAVAFTLHSSKVRPVALGSVPWQEAQVGTEMASQLKPVQSSGKRSPTLGATAKKGPSLSEAQINQLLRQSEKQGNPKLTRQISMSRYRTSGYSSRELPSEQ